MGKLVKLIGSGLGLASEAIHDYRARSNSRSTQTGQSQTGQSPSSPLSPNTAVASSSRSLQAGLDGPPEYSDAVGGSSSGQQVSRGSREAGGQPSRGNNAEGSSRNEKRSKAAEAGYRDEEEEEDEDDESSSSSNGEDGDGEDEEAWELDEMAERVAPPSYVEAVSEQDLSEEGKIKKEEQMIRDMVRLAGAPPQPPRRLPCPVIIPQRRPRNKDRGFVRAYAPVLEECGISQEVFLKFLQDWLVASKADPWIDILFIAAGIVGFVPETAAQIVSAVVQVVAGTARELQSRSRRNTFLDRVNQELLMPRGLYAMVMAFKDEVPGQQQGGGPLSKITSTLGKSLFSSERLDINQTAAKYSNPDPNLSRVKKGLKNIRLVDGKTYTELELPEAAALVYPDLDRAVERDLQQANGKGPGGESVKEKWKGAGEWVQDYLDRKAQAAYEIEHQDSKLAVPSSARKAFSSRFSDPNHAVNSGSLISLLTGGTINPASRRLERRSRKYERKALKRDYKDLRRMARGKLPKGPRRAGRKQLKAAKKRKPGIIKKILQQNVLYLLIVNLPTDQEVQESVNDLERMMSTSSSR